MTFIAFSILPILLFKLALADVGYTVTPMQDHPGQLSGQTYFTGKGYFISSRCWCSSPHHIVDKFDEGHQYDYAYYNAELDRTFTLNETCVANHGEVFTCIGLKSETCGSYKTDSGMQSHTLCVAGYKDPGKMIMTFDGHARVLDWTQGRKTSELREAEMHCDARCYETTRLDLLRKNRKVKCRREMWDEMGAFPDYHIGGG